VALPDPTAASNSAVVLCIAARSTSAASEVLYSVGSMKEVPEGIDAIERAYYTVAKMAMCKRKRQARFR
jgi:hypothetical protein